MARKSRKETVVLPAPEIDTSCRAGIYVRLSVEDKLKAGLAIIAKQLEQYKMLSQDAQYIKEDRQLTAALIDRLIDRVEVSREKRITVRFRFQSEFEQCEEVLSQCRNM